MKIIFLLGNPGSDYRDTRHNVAWQLVGDDSFEWLERSKFRAYIAESRSANGKALYVRPTTYYNESGVALRSIMDYYKVETADVVVVHDDLMLPFGTVRSRIGGRDAGNNGLKSIAQHVDGDIARIRIGIANDQRAVMGDTAFVLGKFSSDERGELAAIKTLVESLIEDFKNDRLQVTTHRHE